MCSKTMWKSWKLYKFITRFSCCCAPGYTGSECDELIDICLTNPCSTEGVQTCISTSAASFTCSCKAGYTGRYCEININECASQPVRFLI